ncbi:hypothetical protein CYY_001823 [Polysphondylium violaceum]|uniref:Transmembrane protein n=1 Tax=Polysphondylium violaceum TaxID=133409 RepID=A0A8J4Q8N7_9MYCE|nr:hypothetical protein CYY_001823 [Polysphondylium violaceum]
MIKFKIIYPILLSIFFITWILLIVSYASYWYRYENKLSQTTLKFKHDRVHESLPGGGHIKYSWTYQGREEQAILRASVSFAILSWIFTTICLVLVALHLFDILHKIPLLPMRYIAKFLPLIPLACSILALLICLGFNRAVQRDCQNTLGSNSVSCDLSWYHSFVGHGEMDSWHPDVGWVVTVFTSAFLLAASVISIGFASFEAAVSA